LNDNGFGAFASSTSFAMGDQAKLG